MDTRIKKRISLGSFSCLILTRILNRKLRRLDKLQSNVELEGLSSEFFNFPSLKPEISVTHERGHIDTSIRKRRGFNREIDSNNKIIDFEVFFFFN